MKELKVPTWKWRGGSKCWSVESGEGIESIEPSCTAITINQTWNPVKELKGTCGGGGTAGEEKKVESGEGIESSA